MKEFLKKIKSSEPYEILKEQSAMIIFVATLLGSFLTLITKINTYLYDLGRFTKYNIPVDLISSEAFSFYDIVKIFGSILCYISGILTIYCIRIMLKSELSVAKLNYKLYGVKREYIKNLICSLIRCLFLSIILLSVDGLTILISLPASKTGILIGSVLIIIFQWIYSGQLVKKTNKKIEKRTVKDDKKEESATLVKKVEKFTDDEALELANESIRANKAMNYLLIVLPIVIIFFFASIMGISNFIAGKNSTDNTKLTYQIVTFEKGEYVVLDKSEDNYILAKILNSENDVLIIDTSEQRLVSVNEIKYRLKKFNKVILEEPK